MDQKTTDASPEQIVKENEDLHVVINELSQNVAYLSRMVMQLQRSINGKRTQTDQPPAQRIIH